MRWLLVMVYIMVSAVMLQAQTGTINGKVKTKDGTPAGGVVIKIESLKTGTLSNTAGIFVMTKIPAGTYTIAFGGVGYKKSTRQVTVKSNEITLVEDVVEGDVKSMNEVTVYGASRREQKITEAPSAISVVLPEDIQRSTSHGQAARTLSNFQGVDVVQSGMNDFNVNTRGFNNSINRRMLVITDGRDMSTPLLNLVEWNSFQTNLADIKTIEVVRGPGSALYGSNAYNGVVNIITNAPKDVLGTRISVTGGEFGTLRGDIRHAREITDDLSIKVNAGYSQQNQEWIKSRDITKGGALEYAGIAPDVALKEYAPINGVRTFKTLPVDSMLSAHKKAFNLFATLRTDYELDANSKVIGEVGYSEYGNEYFVNQTGRILIPKVTKPFARLAYSSPRLNVQAHYYNRNTPVPQIVLNAPATSAEQSNVVVLDAQWNDRFLNDDLKLVLGASHEYQHVNTSVVDALALLNPDNLHNNFSGVYGQLEYNIMKNLQFVGAARYDRSTFFESQFSPKAAIVYSPVNDHTFRVTYNRSFLRPSYGDIQRRSPAGQNLSTVIVPRDTNNAIRDTMSLAKYDTTIAKKYGTNPLGLGTTLRRWNLGNPNIGVETAQSFEFGYKGIISSSLFVTVDAYYNARTNFISVPLGGLAPDTYAPVRYGNVQADSALKAHLGATDFGRFARDVDGTPAMIVSTRNIGQVNETGVEVGINYYVIENLLLNANVSLLGYDVKDNQLSASIKIVPNTSTQRINFGAQYTEPKLFDVGFNFRYVEGFDWVAGTFNGYVPSYGVLDVNASLDMSRWVNGARLGVNVFNALNREHYQIFGGTYLYRYATATLSYQF